MFAFRTSRTRLVLSAFFILSGLAWAVGPLGAEPPAPPPYYAIQNVRVVTGAGDPIEGATVLLADGIIEAVGKKVKIPADVGAEEGKRVVRSRWGSGREFRPDHQWSRRSPHDDAVGECG